MLASHVEDRDKLDVKNMKTASNIAFPVAIVGAVDGSWSSAAAAAKGGRIVVGLRCVLASNAARTVEFNSSGNVDTVGSGIKLEVVPVEFEILRPWREKAESKPQPCGEKPRLSLLMMSAA